MDNPWLVLLIALAAVTVSTLIGLLVYFRFYPQQTRRASSPPLDEPAPLLDEPTIATGSFQRVEAAVANNRGGTTSAAARPANDRLSDNRGGTINAAVSDRARRPATISNPLRHPADPRAPRPTAATALLAAPAPATARLPQPTTDLALPAPALERTDTARLDYPLVEPPGRFGRLARPVQPQQEASNTGSALIGLVLLLSLLTAGWLAYNALTVKPIPVEQFAVYVARFGSGEAAERLTDELVKRDLTALNRSGQPAIFVYALGEVVASPEQAQRIARQRNADILIWGTAGDNGASFSPHLALNFNNPLNGYQRQGLYRQLLHPSNLDLGEVSRSSQADVLTLVNALAAYSHDDLSEAESLFGKLKGSALPANLLHFYHANAALLLEEPNAAAAAVEEYKLAAGLDDAATLNNRGVALLNSGNPAAAATDFSRALERLEGAADRAQRAVVPLRNRAAAKLQLGDRQGGRDDLNLALELNPDYVPALFDRASLGYDLEQQSGDPVKANADYQRVLALDPEYADALVQNGALWLVAKSDLAIGGDLLGKGRAQLDARATDLPTSETVRKNRGERTGYLLKRIAAASDSIAVARYWQARLDIAQGVLDQASDNALTSGWKRISGSENKLERAAAGLQAALKTRPNWYEAHYHLARTHRAQGRADLAVQDLTEAKQLDAGRPDAYTLTADIYQAQGQTDNAIAEYNTLLQHNPGFIGGYLALARFYTQLKRPDDATAVYRRAVAIPATTAQDFYDQGEAYDELKDDAGAVAAYQRAVALDQGWAQARMRLGGALERSRQFDAAISEYQRAAQQGASATSANYRSGRSALAKGDRDAALHYWSATVQAEGLHMPAHYAAGQLYRNLGNLDAAAQQFTAAVASRPDTAAAEGMDAGKLVLDSRLQLGSIYQAQGKLAEAEAAYNAATIDAQDFATVALICDFYARRGNVEAALKVARDMERLQAGAAAIPRCVGLAQLNSGDDTQRDAADDNLLLASQRDPNDAETLTALGQAYLKLGRDNEAAAQFNNVRVRSGDQNANALVGAGDLAARAGDRATALTLYRTAVNRDGNNPASLTAYGRAIVAENRAQAEQYYRTAMEKDASYAPAYLELGRLLAAQGQEDRALKAYQIAVSLRSGWGEAHYLLGRSLLKRGEGKSALVELLEATKRGPSQPEFFNGLGDAQRAVGDRPAAITAYRKATELNGDYAAAWMSLGQTLAENGDRVTASEVYVKVRDNTRLSNEDRNRAADALAALP